MPIVLPEFIQSQRLSLRKPRASDAKPIFEAYTQDFDVARYLVWRPHQSLSETEAFISSCMQGWASGQRRPYVLTRREDDSIPIGMLEARFLPNGIDLGYVLQRSCWGAGLMKEAIVVLSDVALTLPECVRVQATCDTENLASARVLEKAGFVREGRLERHSVLPNLGSEPRPSFMYARCK
ncbi:GNAT family N-acetyltransferase [Massilia suwonensis]|uniref:GNAT family N-acetyltransferase n=1 Tax=Massilia suwonensis TaxID=648895 RepID=A0ABW0MM23_9BURK